MTVVNKQELAMRITGRSRAETQQTLSDGQTMTYQTVAVTDSFDGTVFVEPFGEFVSEEDDAYIEVDTTIVVKKGDTVFVTLYGDSIGKSMVVTGVIGRGDQQQNEINTSIEGVEGRLGTHDTILEALAALSEDLARANGDLQDVIEEIHTELIDFTEKIGGYIDMHGDVIELGSTESPIKQYINSDGASVVNTTNGETLVAQFGENAYLPNIETNYIRMGDMLIVKRQPVGGTHITFKGV